MLINVLPHIHCLTVLGEIGESLNIVMLLQLHSVLQLLARKHVRERDTSVYNVVVSPTSDGGHIHLNPTCERDRHQCLQCGSIPNK